MRRHDRLEAYPTVAASVDNPPVARKDLKVAGREEKGGRSIAELRLTAVAWPKTTAA